MSERSLTAEAGSHASASECAPPGPIPPPPRAMPLPPELAKTVLISPGVPPETVAPSAHEPGKASLKALAAETDGESVWWEEFWLHVPSWLTSTVLHLTLVLLLALITTMPRLSKPLEEITISTVPGDGGSDGDLESGPEGGPSSDELMQLASKLDEVMPPAGPLNDLPVGDISTDTLGPISAMLPGLPTDDANLSAGGGSGIGVPDVSGLGGGGGGGGEGNSLAMRLNPGRRGELVRSGGGTKESEAAVELALKWLADHQNYDGSWSFDHSASPKCHGQCANPGFTPGHNAATAMALLPFLGTGQTQREGQYRKTIDMGLKYLVRAMEVEGNLGSLHEPGGTMYGHGLASIALCEAYGMTHDVFLEVPAQQAINFIQAAQDPVGGGWRYMFGQPGDTSVVGWQLMALKSGRLAYLRVNDTTLKKAGYFLDRVQSERGATYGYQSPESRRPATTAIGLLCRMYLGWKHQEPGLVRGVEILSQMGPSTDKSGMRNNMYYNYYATQVMHHFGGYRWQRWNAVMREYLIQTQSRRGHEYGSWFLDGTDHGSSAGGRLYCTCLAAMTLEVYYRYMPLYREQSVAAER